MDSSLKKQNIWSVLAPNLLYLSPVWEKFIPKSHQNPNYNLELLAPLSHLTERKAFEPEIPTESEIKPKPLVNTKKKQDQATLDVWLEALVKHRAQSHLEGNRLNSRIIRNK